MAPPGDQLRPDGRAAHAQHQHQIHVTMPPSSLTDAATRAPKLGARQPGRGPVRCYVDPRSPRVVEGDRLELGTVAVRGVIILVRPGSSSSCL
jgi:hypothetical protein